MTESFWEFNLDKRLVFFFFFFFAVVKGPDSKYLGLCWPATTKLCHAEWKQPWTVPTEWVWWCFGKTLVRNKADLIPCQSLLTLALEKLWNFTFIFYTPSPWPSFLKVSFICVVQILSYQIHIYMFVCVCAQSCLTLCDSMNCSLPGSTVHGVFQAKILEWAANSYSRGSSQPKDWTHVSCVSCTGRQTLVARVVKNMPAMQETRIRSLGWEGFLKKGMATHSSILACGIPWAEEPCGV